MKISLLLFDLGNVLTSNDWHVKNQVLEKAFATIFHTTVEDLERGFQAAWDKFEMGHIDEDQFWNLLLRTAGLADPDVEQAKQLWRQHQKVDPQMLNLIQTLRLKYKIGILSNIPKEWLAFKMHTLKLIHYVDSVTDSSSVGIAKPNPKIYKVALDRNHAQPEETVFIDDKERNLIPARQLGMQTILFTDFEGYKKSLQEMGVARKE